MATFLLGKHNLADLEDMHKSRDNLGLGDLATQNIADLDLSGSGITLTNFRLDDGYQENNRVLMCDDQGNARWADVDVGTQNNNLSQFVNDMNYLTRDQAMDPSLNLSDLEDKDQALINLGLATLIAPEDEDGNKSIGRVRLDKLFMDHLIQGEILYTNEESEVKTIPIINDPDNITSESAYNILNIPDNASKEKIPSAFLLRGLFQFIDTNIKSLSNNINVIQSEVNDLGNSGGGSVSGAFLRSLNNLEDLTDKSIALTNLGLDFINTNTNSINANTISTTNLIYPLDVIFEDNMFLTVDFSGNTSWSLLPDASVSQKGIVIIDDDQTNFDHLYRVYSRTYLNNKMNGMDVKQLALESTISTLTTRLDGDIAAISVPANISAFTNDSGYLKSSLNLSDLDSSSLAAVRGNLGLHEVASTGSYDSLNNIPVHLNQSELNSRYIKVQNNLSDLVNIPEARNNLGLNNMCLQQNDNINIIGGTITNISSIITNELVFKDNAIEIPNYETLSNITFVRAVNPSGAAGWKQLPPASHLQQGIVFCIDNETEDRSYVDDIDYHCVHTSKYSEFLLSNIELSIQSVVTYADSRFDDVDVAIQGAVTYADTRFDQVGVSIQDITDAIGSGTLIPVSLEELNVKDLTSSNLYYRSNEEPYHRSGTTDFRKVLAMNTTTKECEWVSVSNVLIGTDGSYSVDVRRDLIEAVSVNTQSLDVYRSIQFEDLHRSTPDVPLREGSIIYKDGDDLMHWTKKIRVTDDHLGLEFMSSSTDYMTIQKEDNQIVIGHKSSEDGTIIPKHIFR